MPTIKKIKDWRGWWDGLRSKAVKAGCESLATNLTAMLSTNGVANMHIPGMEGIGMTWKTALATALVQFFLRTAAAAVSYVSNKPDPDIIEQSFETEIVSKPVSKPPTQEKNE
jgi:hypothetical protein